MTRTIVIIHPGGLGDLLLAVPAIRSVRARFLRHQLLLCGHDQACEFLHECCRLIDRWMSVQTTACTALFGGAEANDLLLKDWLSRCDVAVAWTKDERGTLAAALKNSGAAAVLVESPFCSTLTAVHQSDRFLEILNEPAAEHSVMKPFAVPASLRERAAACLHACDLPSNRPLVLVHPGSGSRHKCVKPAVLASVVQQLQKQGVVPLVLEGPADQEPVGNLLSHLPIKPSVLRGLSLSVLAGVLSRVELFVGHDSGITHLSALLGIPTVALFGPTSPARWAPRGSHVVIVQGESCRCFSWDEVSHCVEKPCLQLSPEAILAACRVQELPA
jgi:ADP-heptose:LPS heptosyltransferase